MTTIFSCKHRVEIKSCQSIQPSKHQHKFRCNFSPPPLQLRPTFAQVTSSMYSYPCSDGSIRVCLVIQCIFPSLEVILIILFPQIKKNCLPTSHQPPKQILPSYLIILLVLRRQTSLTIPLGHPKSGYGYVGWPTNLISLQRLNLFLQNKPNFLSP